MQLMISYSTLYHDELKQYSDRLKDMTKSSTPPQISRDCAREVAATLRQVADRLDALAAHPDVSSDPGWGIQAAELGLSAKAAGEVVSDSGMAVAALEGVSLRRIGEALNFTFSAIPRRLAGTPELAAYAEGATAPRVTQGGIERARYDLRQGEYRVEDAPERVARRKRG